MNYVVAVKKGFFLRTSSVKSRSKTKETAACALAHDAPTPFRLQFFFSFNLLCFNLGAYKGNNPASPLPPWQQSIVASTRQDRAKANLKPSQHPIDL
jgi:hypothetical protein